MKAITNFSNVWSGFSLAFREALFHLEEYTSAKSTFMAAKPSAKEQSTFRTCIAKCNAELECKPYTFEDRSRCQDSDNCVGCCLGRDGYVCLFRQHLNFLLLLRSEVCSRGLPTTFFLSCLLFLANKIWNLLQTLISVDPKRDGHCWFAFCQCNQCCDQ